MNRKTRVLFSLLPNPEELKNSQRDEYGRFLYKYSTQYDLFRTDTSRPISKQNHKENLLWPHGKSFALCLTHDIDHMKTYWKMVIRRLQNRLSKDDYLRLKEGAKWFFVERFLPKSIFKHIIELEKEYDAKSIFFFMATEDWDKRYDIRRYESVLKFIEGQGWEIGLHAGMESYNNVEILREEKERLEASLKSRVIGIRQHFLRLDPRRTWHNHIEAGFLFDCTYGYPDHVGFKNGCAFPFHPIDANTKKELSIVEIPLVIMDGIVSDYMGYPFETHFEEAWNVCKNVLEEIKRVGGCSSILWHADQFNECLYPRSGEFYERILQYGKEHNAWMTGGKEIYNYLMSNNESQ